MSVRPPESIGMSKPAITSWLKEPVRKLDRLARIASYEHVDDLRALKALSHGMGNKFDFIMLVPDLMTPGGAIFHTEGPHIMLGDLKTMLDARITHKALQRSAEPIIHDIYKQAAGALAKNGKIIYAHSSRDNLIRPSPKKTGLKTKIISEKVAVFHKRPI